MDACSKSGYYREKRRSSEEATLQSHIIYERQKMFNPVPRPRTWPGDEDPNVGGAGSQSSKQSAAMQLTGCLHHCWVVFVLLSSLNLVLGSSSAKLSPSMVFYHDVKPGPSLSQSGYNVSHRLQLFADSFGDHQVKCVSHTPVTPLIMHLDYARSRWSLSHY